jgi:predicted phosphoribosyltransferase
MTAQENAELAALGRRVDALDEEVRKLRGEFDNYRVTSENADRDMVAAMGALDGKLDRHVVVEDQQYREQDKKISEIQRSIAALLEELKEPMEVYKTTKYGAKAATSLVYLVRYLVPIGAAVIIGYNAWQAKVLEDARAAIPATTASAAQHKEDGQ